MASRRFQARAAPRASLVPGSPERNRWAHDSKARNGDVGGGVGCSGRELIGPAFDWGDSKRGIALSACVCAAGGGEDAELKDRPEEAVTRGAVLDVRITHISRAPTSNARQRTGFMDFFFDVVVCLAPNYKLAAAR
jgi:hypothetical protein